MRPTVVRRALRRGMLATGFLFITAANGVVGQSNGLLDGANLMLAEVSDSGDYLLYEYKLVNGNGSLSSLAGVSLDVAATGTGHMLLATTGHLDDGVSMRPAGAPFSSHVPLGVISPANWQAFLMRFGTIEWFGSRGGTVALDTVAAGSELFGFGLRSPYLPGLRDYSAEPSWQSCCSQPLPNAPGVNPGEHASPEMFAVSGRTVGPTRAAADFTDAMSTLNAVSSDLVEVCVLGWVSNRTCRSLSRNIRRALKDLERGRTRGVGRLLERVNRTLVGNRGGSINDNAYWLLSINIDYAVSQLGTSGGGRGR